MPATADADYIASFSVICPLCSKFIRQGKSKIHPLKPPLVPRGDGQRSSDDGWAYHSDGRPISMHPRKWAHGRCYRRYMKEQSAVTNTNGTPSGLQPAYRLT